MKRQSPSIRLIILLFVLILGLSLLPPRLTAQTLLPWQAANDIRTQGLTAQKEMFAAARADDPASHYAVAAAYIDDAMILYTTALQPHLEKTASLADEAITQSLLEAGEAARSGDALALAAAWGRVWTNILWGSHEMTLAALARGDASTAATWLQLREYRQATKVTVIEDTSTRAIAALEAGEADPAATADIVGNDLRDAYFFRLREALNELEEAVENNFASRAAEWAGQARGYFNILQADMSHKQGEATTAQLAKNLAALEQSVINGDTPITKNKIAEVHAALANYQPIELDTAEVAKRGQLLYLFTDLIYVEYKNGVRNGEITIPIEYQEALTFRDQAEAVFEEIGPVMATNDGQATERYAQLLAEMDEIMADLGEVEAIKARVEEARGLVGMTLEVSADTGDSESALVIINTLLDKVVAAAQAGHYAEAERTRLEAYAMFESGLEQRLVNRAPVMSRELEGLFWEGSGGQKGLATLLSEEAPSETIAVEIELLRTKLNEAQSFLAAELTGVFAFLNSLAIIIREGLEAVLIIGAILGYLRATQAPQKYSAWVYLGIAGAILLSILTWLAARSLITISVANRELFEGVTSLIAVAVLFYVTNWLFHKVYVIDWLTFVKEQVGKALGTGRAVALAGLGFTVVYREGFETVLFYQALLFDAQAAPVWLGFIAGVIIILAIAYAILKLSKRLPLKPFFTGTAIMLLLLAFSLTGKGVRELQEAGVIAVSLLSWVPENLVLMEVFGIFPTLETTLAQILLLMAIVITFAISRWQGQRRPKTQTAASQSS